MWRPCASRESAGRAISPHARVALANRIGLDKLERGEAITQRAVGIDIIQPPPRQQIGAGFAQPGHSFIQVLR